MTKLQTIKIDATESEYPGLAGLHATLMRYCLSLTGSRWDAEDLAQDAWAKAVGTLQGSGHQNAEAFLLRIAKNTWIDHSRRKQALTRILSLAKSEPMAAEGGFLELETAFGALVRHLSPLQRTVFLLRDVLDFSSAETAEWLRTTEGAVKAALHRARQALDTLREELRAGSLPEPNDEGLKLLLRSLAVAYQDGDIARLAELAQQDVLNPVTAIGIAQGGMLRKRKSESRPAAVPTAWMRAA